MDPQVLGQRAGVGEGLLAHAAPAQWRKWISCHEPIVAIPCLPSPVRPLPAVGSHVRGHAAGLGKLPAKDGYCILSSHVSWVFSAPVADGAVERLLPAVRSAVGGQVGGLRKRLVAAVAPVGALAAVGPQVGLQGAGASVPKKKFVLISSMVLYYFPSRFPANGADVLCVVRARIRAARVVVVRREGEVVVVVMML